MRAQSRCIRCIYRSAAAYATNKCRGSAWLALCTPRGTPEDKLRIIFDAYDEDRSGEIDEIEMRKMLTSTLAIESKAHPLPEIDPLPSPPSRFRRTPPVASRAPRQTHARVSRAGFFV